MSLPFDVEAKQARDAQRLWRMKLVRERLRPVREFRFLLVEHRQQLCKAVEADVKRPAAEVISTDGIGTAAAAKFLEQHAERILRPYKPRGRPLWLFDSSEIVYREPFGLIGLIATWNYPVFLTVVPLLQALTAGNAVLWKPSEQTPRTAEALEELFRRAGFPHGLIQRLPATREAGPQLIEADIDFLHFTGSDLVGRKIAARLGERLIPSVLELSGIDAMIVIDGADVQLAARTAWYGTTLNRGQTCLATRRVLIDQRKLSEFLDVLKSLVEATPPVRLQTESQANHARALIADATKHGAKVIIGQGPNPTASADPDCVPPAVIISPSTDLAICRQATFAPLLAVVPFDTIPQAVDWHNQCPFGLGASIFAGSRSEGELLARQLHCGSVVINDVIVPTAHPGTPFSGRGSSGWGSTQGEEGLLAMTVPKAISYRHDSRRPHVDCALINDPQLGPMMEGMLLAGHNRTLWGRLRGLRQFLRAYLRSGQPGP